MRNRLLHQSLRDFAEQAAFQLEADATNGHEIPFEVIESPGANAPLYCYRPLTADFIRERIGVLGELPTYLPARRALESRTSKSDLAALPPAKRRDRVARFLLSRGFDSDVVISLLDEAGLRVEV